MHTVCGFLFKLGPFVIIRTLQTPERCSLKTLLPQRNTDTSEIGLNYGLNYWERRETEKWRYRDSTMTLL